MNSITEGMNLVHTESRGYNMDAHFKLQIGDIIDGTEHCTCDMEGLIIKITKVFTNGNYIAKVIKSADRLYKNVNDIWDLSYMDGNIHKGCLVYRGVKSWNEVLK